MLLIICNQLEIFFLFFSDRRSNIMIQRRSGANQQPDMKEVKVNNNYSNKIITSGRHDLNGIAKIVKDSSTIIQSVKNTNSVLTFGNTKAGKSTLINYLIGVPIVQVKHQAISKPLPGQRYAIIGEKIRSKTFNPEAFESKEGFSFCDFPGQIDTGTTETRICASINSQLAIDLISNIRALMVVIDFNSILTDGGIGLKALGGTFARTFVDMKTDTIAKSVLFLITKAPSDVTKEDVTEKIEELINVQEENLESLTSKVSNSADFDKNKEEINKYNLTLIILNFMKENQDNIFLINVLDEGETRQKIYKKLSTLEPIPKEAVNFGANDPDRIEFNEMMQDVIGKLTVILRERNQRPIDIHECTQQIKASREQARFYATQVTNIESGKKQKEYVSDLTKRIDSNNVTSNQLQIELKSRIDDITEKSEFIKNKDTSDNKLQAYVAVDATKVRAEYKLLLFNNYKYDFKIRLDPNKKITLIEKKAASDGVFSDEKLDIINNTYKITYKYGFIGVIGNLLGMRYSYNHGHIAFYVASRDYYAADLFIVKDSIDKSGKRCTVLSKEIERLAEENQSLTKLFTATVSDEKEAKEKNKEEMENKRRFHNKRADELSETLKVLEYQLSELDSQVILNQEIFESVAIIVKIASFPMCQSLAKEFLNQFKRLATPEVMPPTDFYKDISEKLLCPLTKKIMQNPQVLDCGDSFDFQAIADYFQEQDKNHEERRCPECSRRIVDGMRPNVALAKLIEDENAKKVQALQSSASDVDGDMLKKLEDEVERLKTEFQLKQAELDSKKEILQQRLGVESHKMIGNMLPDQMLTLDPKQEELKQLFQAADDKSLLQLRKLKYQKVNFHLKEDKRGDSVLHRAAAAGSGEEVISFLVKDCGCMLDDINYKGETPLLHAVIKNHIDAARALIQLGANLTIQYCIKNEALTVLQIALRGELSLELIKLLVSQELIDVNAVMRIHNLPLLHLIAQEGHTEALEFYVNNCKANVDIADEKYSTPLIRAAKHNKLAIVKTLIEYNAQFNCENAPEKAILNSKNIQDEIIIRLRNYVSNLKSRHQEAIKNVSPIAKDIIRGISDYKKESKQIQNTYHLEEVLQSALLNSDSLASITALWEDKATDENKQTKPLLPEKSYHSSVKLLILSEADTQQWAEVDSPDDGSCLFYSVVFSTLLEVIHDKNRFNSLFVKLFGDNKHSSAPEDLRVLLQEYDGNPQFVKNNAAVLEVLVENDFRSEVVSFMKKNKETFSAIEYTESKNFDEEMERMKKPRTWGSNREIEAISRILQKNIIVYTRDAKDNLVIVSTSGETWASQKPVRLVHGPSNNFSEKNNHYHYLVLPGLLNPVIDIQKEIKESLPSRLYPTKEHLINYIARFLAYRVKEKPYEWELILEKESGKKDKNFGNKFKELIKEVLQSCSRMTPIELINESFSLWVIISLKLDKYKEFNTALLQWIKAELPCNQQLKIHDINDQKLRGHIINELNHSLNDNNDLKQPEAILKMRIKIAILYWLKEKNFLSLDESLESNLLQNLFDKLKKHNIKPKKLGIIYYLVKNIISTYPKETPVIDLLNQSPEESEEFITGLFKLIMKDKMKHLSSDTLSQENFENRLRLYVTGWISKYLENMKNSTPTVVLSSNIKDAIVLPSKATNLPADKTLRGNPATLFCLAPESKRKSNTDILEEKTNKFTDKQKFFISHFCQEFEKFYCMYRALDFKIVQRLKDNTDDLARKVSEYKNTTLTVAGFEIPVGTIGDLIMKLVIYRKDKSIEQAAKRIGWLFGHRRIDENGKLIKYAADIIASRYQFQINALTTESIGPLGMCAARRCIQFITASDENLMNTPTGVFAWMKKSIHNALTDKKYGPISLEDYKDPLAALITGVIEGESKEDQDYHLSTEAGETWLPLGIFRNVGYIVKIDHEYQLYTHESLMKKSTDGSMHGALRYGYCLIEAWEVELIKKAGYMRDNTTSVDEVFKRFNLETVRPEPVEKQVTLIA